MAATTRKTSLSYILIGNLITIDTMKAIEIYDLDHASLLDLINHKELWARSMVNQILLMQIKGHLS